MNIRRKVLAKAAAGCATLGLAVTGTVTIPAAPAQALSETNYGFMTAAYGTKVVANQVELKSGRTAYSYLNCTRLAGLKRSESLAEVKTPGNAMVSIGAVKSTNRTFKNLNRGIVAADESTSTVGDITLGEPGTTPVLKLKALKTRATSWATKNGRLHADTHITAGNVRLDLLPSTDVDAPLQDLLDAVTEGLQQVFSTLQQHGGRIEIPGLGTVHLGYERTSVTARKANAVAAALRISLVNGSTVQVGRARAVVLKDIPAGVMSGRAYGLDVSLLDGVVDLGRLGNKVLPCEGTRGRVRDSSFADINLGGADLVALGAANGRVYGTQSKDGRAAAWTEGSLAGVKIGPKGRNQVVIKGIVGRVNLKQNRAGKIVRRDIKGSTLGSFTFGGRKQPMPSPGDSFESPLANIEFFVKDKHNRRGLGVTALRITLAPGTAGESVVEVGVARATLRKY